MADHNRFSTGLSLNKILTFTFVSILSFMMISFKSQTENSLPATKKHFIGEAFGGGIVFYVDSTEEHGFIVSNEDISTKAKWGFSDTALHANAKNIGAGRSNTSIITKTLTDSTLAAGLCTHYKVDKFNDWFLPSKKELELIYDNLKTKNLGNFADAYYWSSSETDFNNAWLVDFKSGIPIEQNTISSGHVRAIREF
ncbi:DUF1566 domain-containing protein [Ferruginibacter lapsinanis]|uniref:Lcl domain-containing protein n=1 Tax=Ferruginibacter lapsinanis TaxID=563172 RepID=UPI001E55505B|nr:DUF1566 domain-containing protein [Ferruginibacter lapsinanis]UEG49637.1 DUF1566 domain-containing protein [Ferruginibacter lapsinanis]